MKTVVDPDMCIGCELCCETAPDVYIMNDDGFAVAIEGDVAGDQEELVAQACDECPADAITNS